MNIDRAEKQIPKQYDILCRLGNQTVRKFSEVYLIREPNGRQSVLKRLVRLESNKTAQERLLGEAQFSFDFPGLPQVIAFEENAKEILLQLTFQRGRSLSELAAGMSVRKRREALSILLPQLAKLLTHIHEKNILHLDLKPDNIIVSATNEVSLIDFGMAIDRKSVEGRGTLFSLPYAAPELVLNRMAMCDHRTDYFSLGIVIYFFLTGKLPFSVSNPALYTNLQLVHPLPEVSGIGKRRNELLRQITAKPVFMKPPNQLAHEVRDRALIKALEARPDRLSDWVELWLSAESRSFLNRLRDRL